MNKMFAMLGLCALVSMQAAPAQSREAAQAGRDATALVPVQDFFRTPQLIKPVLSPDGRYLAAAMGNPRGRLALVVLDLRQLDAPKGVASFSDADVYNYHWVNADRLVLSVTDTQSADRPLAPGMWAVNRDGSDFRQLIKTESKFLSTESSSVADRRLSWEWRLHSTLGDGSADVLVTAPVFNSIREVVDSRLARLDTQTGRMHSLGEGAPEHVRHWVVDREGRPAALTTWFHGRFASYLKTDQGWRLWEEAEGFRERYADPY